MYHDAPFSFVPITQNSHSLLDFHPLEVKISGVLVDIEFAWVDILTMFVVLQLARQMAVLEWTYFAAIPIKEYYRKSWAGPINCDEKPMAPHLINYIERFNKVRLTIFIHYVCIILI